MLKIYVAGKWAERQQVKNIMEMLEARGHTITCDWTIHINPKKSKAYAQEDLEGVNECDILIAYMPDSTICYKGAWIEIGIALGFGKKVIIIGDKISSVFLSLPNIVVVNYKEEALEIINNLDYFSDCLD